MGIYYEPEHVQFNIELLEQVQVQVQQQIRRIRDIAAFGQIPNWFKELEKIVLENGRSRKIKREFQHNTNGIKPQVRINQKAISDKNPRRNGVVEWNSLKENKENSSPEKHNKVPIQERKLLNVIQVKKTDIVDVSSWVRKQEQEKTVGNTNRKEELWKVLKENQSINEVVFYTDSLLGGRDTENFRMGHSLVQIGNNGKVIREIIGRSKNWFLSTRAEIIAILKAIFISPSGSKIEIHTDSQAAIDKIRSLNRKFTSKKTKDAGILGLIKENIEVKNIQVHMKKVKAHTGIKYNERGDVLAKQESALDEYIRYLPTETQGMLIKPTWNGAAIELLIRKFVNMVLETYYKAEWTFCKNQNDNLHLSKKGKKDWKTFRDLWKGFIKLANEFMDANPSNRPSVSYISEELFRCITFRTIAAPMEIEKGPVATMATTTAVSPATLPPNFLTIPTNEKDLVEKEYLRRTLTNTDSNTKKRREKLARGIMSTEIRTSLKRVRREHRMGKKEGITRQAKVGNRVKNRRKTTDKNDTISIEKKNKKDNIVNCIQIAIDEVNKWVETGSWIHHLTKMDEEATPTLTSRI
ncbi:hypothetical protein C2G38_2188405 [Gigaspora rosea]|uniref:RNase H type-1 domain-containing protein n=1 Tax=Gigaspora rosea TaxID=44941 RepID=A0A397VCI2_9GLOM|nr:hypothetical protein C2G38_2188405 [Gigaspora rosea]